LVANPRQIEEGSIGHLAELGYVDPDEVAAREAELRNRRQAELRQAVELNAQGHGQQAVALLIALADEAPDWTAPRQALAEISYRAGRFDEARAHLVWLAQHNVVTPRLALIEGALALARRDLPAALDALEYASTVEPDLPGVQGMLGSVLLRLGRLDRAEAAFERAVEQSPAHACDGLAAIALRRGDYAAAADRALQALEHDMQLARAHYHLGVALAHLDRPAEALAALENFARLEPTRAAPYRWMSQVAAKQLGDSARAAAYLKRGRQTIRLRRERRSS
jgi:tetratricopeptide (TPR) repeat protein